MTVNLPLQYVMALKNQNGKKVWYVPEVRASEQQVKFYESAHREASKRNQMLTFAEWVREALDRAAESELKVRWVRGKAS
jgi:hypothetical protein